eukprot:scaffold6358_cov55-Phaeocystis_antarctica.AAC.3
MRGAHPEHVAHVRDAGRVEAQRLVERRRALPGRKEGVYDAGRGVGRGQGGVGRRQRTSGMHGKRARAHVEHIVHGCDAGRVEARRLVERQRVLPSRKEGRTMRGEVLAGAGGRGPAAAHERHARREGPAVKAGGARACAERTWNMPYMSATLDVSKLSGWLNADAPCRVETRAYGAGRGVGRGREGVGRRQRTSGIHGERARL